jgi:serine/threonine protein phosphatase PrpC
MFVHSISLLGKRPTNEDKHLVFLNIDNNNTNLAPINLFCVFDGHGGNKVSTFLKKFLPSYFIKKDVEYPIPKSLIQEISDRLQKKIKLVLGKHADNMGSTCLVIVQYQKNNKYYLQIVNSGDSRAVINQSNLAIPLTKDHKPDWFDEKNRITQLGGTIKIDEAGDWRVNEISVSRAFGDATSEPFITHRPEIFNRQLCNDDKFIILACDGLWDVLTNQDAVNFILEQMFIDKNTGLLLCKDKRKNIARLLADYAIAKGSQDNITVIIVFL